ncbi:FAD-dependent oxidoreductase [Streptomyces sp. NPDC057717]|uniref:FAD-dependent oxidoreductase n=1 Tax=Streptomyces sp. NPDC057717 TaxID=3346224 RepID=UPI003679D324
MRILVAGAGVSGLALALALQKRGIAAEVVEKIPEFQTPGTAVHLPGNAVRVLELLGLEKELQKISHPVQRQMIYDRNGQELSSLSTSSIWSTVGSSLTVSYDALRSLLQSAIDIRHIRLNTELTSASPDGRATYKDGSSEAFDLVVGADGIRPVVRENLFHVSMGTPGRVGWHFIAYDVSGDTNNQILCIGGSGRSFLISPLSAVLTFCCAEVDSTRTPAPKSNWQNLFVDFPYKATLLLEQGENAFFTPNTGVIDTDWVRPHAVLIGDAAHPFPFGATQGAPWPLKMHSSWRRRSCQSTARLSSLLAAYRRRRIQRVQWVVDQSKREEKFRTQPRMIRTKVSTRRTENLYKDRYSELHAMP